MNISRLSQLLLGGAVIIIAIGAGVYFWKQQGESSTTPTTETDIANLDSSSGADTDSRIDSDTDSSSDSQADSELADFELPEFLLAFHGCDTALQNCSNPQNHKVYVAESEDESSWSLLPNWEAFSGSVPDIIVRDNILYIFNATSGGTVSQYDLQKQRLVSTQRIAINGVEGFVDPAPILDEDGNIVLFFLYCREDNVSVHCFGPDPSSTLDSEPQRYIGSAVEVPGSEGTEFTLSQGDRLVTDNGTDPDIFYDGSRYVLYVSFGPSFAVYTSSSLHGSYDLPKEADNVLFTRAGGVPSGYFDDALGLYHSFIHATEGSISVLKVATHEDFSSQLGSNKWQTLLSGQDVGLSKTTSIESPGILWLK